MTYAQLTRLLSAASEYSTFYDFLAKEGGSYPDQSAFDTNSVAERLHLIFDFRREVTMADIVKLHPSGAAFARDYNIPPRTAQAWTAKSAISHRDAPRWAVLLFLSDFLSDDDNFPRHS